MSLIEALSACRSPDQFARIFNPTRPEYYRAQDDKAAQTAAAPKSGAVTVTLSDAAKAVLKP